MAHFSCSYYTHRAEPGHIYYVKYLNIYFFTRKYRSDKKEKSAVDIMSLLRNEGYHYMRERNIIKYDAVLGCYRAKDEPRADKN